MGKKKNRNVGIVGIGQTEYSSHKENQNQVEMVNEAVRLALEDANLTLDDIDCVVHGNMELFEMVHQPDMWHALGSGAAGKASFRVTTGGTVGMTVTCAADNLVASGLYDVVLAIGFQKLQECGSTTAGITNMADPLWSRKIQTGALNATSGNDMVLEFGADRARRAVMKHRIMLDKHATLNPRAHRRFHLDYDQIDDLMQKSPILCGELQLIHMCSQSDGACVLILASEERAKKMKQKPVWIRDHVTIHFEEANVNNIAYDRQETTHRCAARTLFDRNGIANPVEYFDVFEEYDPSAWWSVEWLREFLLLKGDEHIKMVENGDFDLDGKLPLNPSGGVIGTNAIGATAMARVAEAALQVRGTAGPHQVKKEVKHALASGFGGCMWSTLMMLEKDLDWQEV
jgi:acetyl-CoA C-acetyltransferase